MKIGDIARLTYLNTTPVDASLAITLGFIIDIRWHENRDRYEYFIFYPQRKVNSKGGWWVPKHRLEVVCEQ